MSEQATANQTRKPLQGTKIGKVVSDRRTNTRKVEVSFLVQDAKYGKYVRRRSVFHVDDPANAAAMGDTVEIAPCRPISKTKSWRLVKILEKAADRAHD